jgi:hypothetical protein
MLNPHHNGGNGSRTGGLRTVSGASLAQLIRCMSPAERACLAADIIDGAIVLVAPTTRAVAEQVRCSATAVFAALRLSPDQREAVRKGERPLIQPQARSQLSFNWTAIDDATLTNVVRLAGVDRTLAIAATVDAHA